MEIPFAKVGSILKFEASCEKNEKNFYGEEFKVTLFFKKQSKLSVFKKTLITDTLETAKSISVTKCFFEPLMYWSGISVNHFHYS